MSDVVVDILGFVPVFALIGLAALAWRARKRGGAYRGGLVGATWELQSRDKREALTAIVEKRAESRRPEYPAAGPTRRRGDDS